MAPSEQQVFIPDSSPNLSPEKKNEELSAWLTQSPYVTFKITRIERSEKESGWYVYYIE